jgi:FRG domain
MVGGFMAKVVRATARMHRRSESTIVSEEEPQKNVGSWNEFEKEVGAIQKNLRRARPETEPHLLFRGQEDSRWALETTLERSGHRDMQFSDYYQLISALRPEVEALTGAAWDKMPRYDQARKWMDEPGEFSVDIVNVHGFPGYEYMVYLRHHGFPSPLLDWTRSPFIAAYFAFRRTIKGVGRASIYVYCEHPNQRKRLPRYESVILSHGPSVRSHRRHFLHFLQQCEYTSCLAFKSPVRFVQHEEIFAQAKRGQDFLWKFNIPTSERVKLLKSLDAHNPNAFSLFGSEESLMETMALREILCGPPHKISSGGVPRYVALRMRAQLGRDRTSICRHIITH